MILTCPSCTTRYMAETSAFWPSGRMVRCASCQHTWFQGPPVDSSFHAISEADQRPDFGTFSPEIDKRKSFLGAFFGQVAGWTIYGLTVAALVTAIYAYRVEIVRLWPKASILYSSLGITVNTRGLAFVNTVYAQFEDEGMEVLAVSGEIENVTSHSLMIPPIRVSLRDAQQREIYDWVFSPKSGELDPRGRREFETRLGNPPTDARDLVITFVQAGDL